MPDTSLTDTGLAGQAAQQNIAAGGDINTLTQLLSGINQNAYLSAPGRQQQLGTIQNQLSGNLDPSTVYQNQLNNAQKYGAGGFGSDSQAWQTAIQRGLGIDRQNLIGAGQTAMNQFYSDMPKVNAQNQAVTPAILEQQQATQAQQALQQQQITNQLNEFGITSGMEQQQITNQTTQFAQTLQNNKDQFASQLGLSYDQLSQQQREFVDSQAQQRTEFDLGLQQRATESAGNLALGYYQASAGRGGGGGGRGGSGSGGSSTPDAFPYTRTTTSTTGTGDLSGDQTAFDNWINSWGLDSTGLPSGNGDLSSGGGQNWPTNTYYDPANGGTYNQDYGLNNLWDTGNGGITSWDPSSGGNSYNDWAGVFGYP
jgi:hypothetical protein